MAIDGGFVLAIGNRAFVDIVFEKVRATLNRRINFRVERLRSRQQCFFTKDDGEVRGDACTVHRTIRRDRAVQTAVRLQS